MNYAVVAFLDGPLGGQLARYEADAQGRPPRRVLAALKRDHPYRLRTVVPPPPGHAWPMVVACQCVICKPDRKVAKT